MGDGDGGKVTQHAFSRWADGINYVTELSILCPHKEQHALAATSRRGHPLATRGNGGFIGRCISSNPRSSIKSNLGDDRNVT